MVLVMERPDVVPVRPRRSGRQVVAGLLTTAAAVVAVALLPLTRASWANGEATVAAERVVEFWALRRVAVALLLSLLVTMVLRLFSRLNR